MTGNRGARRSWLALALMLAALVAVADTTSAGTPGRPADDALIWSSSRPDTIVGVHTPERVVALSFDDGPDPRWTPGVLDSLDRHGAKATFFLEGGAVDRHPDLARQIAARGHEIANHTHDHLELPELESAEVKEQVDRANRAFADAGLPQPTLFRPPRGRFDAEAAAAVRDAGLVTAGWTPTLCVEKWTARLEPSKAMAEMLSRVRPGAILLGHDGGRTPRDQTVAALPALLEGLRSQGYRMVTVSELLALAAPDRAH